MQKIVYLKNIPFPSQINSPLRICSAAKYRWACRKIIRISISALSVASCWWNSSRSREVNATGTKSRGKTASKVSASPGMLEIWVSGSNESGWLTSASPGNTNGKDSLRTLSIGNKSQERVNSHAWHCPCYICTYDSRCSLPGDYTLVQDITCGEKVRLAPHRADKVIYYH